MRLEIFQVDVFTQRVFGGNPAAVIVTSTPLPANLMQSIAAENNLSETVFVVSNEDLESPYSIRWFTPACEVDLCGHATLAAAYVLFNKHKVASQCIEFQSASGSITVTQEAGRLILDFPARPGTVITELKPFAEAVVNSGDRKPIAGLQARDTLLIFSSQLEVETLSPDYEKIKRLNTFAIIASAPGNDCDFVSRFFAPSAGINEDPVTGSAHCTLIPYWSKKLGKKSLFARQLSQRGGELYCQMNEQRVKIGGHVTEYMRGTIELDI